MPGIPWQLILSQAPRLMTAASELLVNSRTRSADIDAAKDVNQLRDRVVELSTDQQTNAALVKELTGQLNVITNAVQSIATRARHAMILGALGVALGLAACLIALLR
jgi:hypothetical protein